MKIGEIIAKMLKKEELTDAEQTFLKDYREPKPVDVAKLNEQIANLQAQFDEVKKERDDLATKAEESASAGQTEAQKLQKQLEKAQTDLKKATDERDAAIKDKGALEYDNSVSALAAENKFTSRDYLKYKLQSAKVDLKDDAAVKTFMESLKKDEAKFFAADVNGGGGGNPPPTPNKDKAPAPGDRIGTIMQGLSEAPEAK